ncbi:DNA metabolism protein [Lithospermum erythrorhizon]|uniref:DNA metabolism protein n=1 Tax=Lithospermum erythrorhizon TaxID=34254 RepID=A0AAV3NYD8_LITER
MTTTTITTKEEIKTPLIENLTCNIIINIVDEKQMTFHVTRVPNAKPGRDSTDIEIYGMQGIPADVLAPHYGEEEEEVPAKALKIGTPSPNAVGVGYPPNFGVRPQFLRPPVSMLHAGWSVPPRPQPWYPQYSAGSAPPPPMGLPSQPLFPVQNIRPAMVSMAPPMGLPPSVPINPPGLTAVPNILL